MENWVKVFVNGQECKNTDVIVGRLSNSAYPAADKFFVHHPDIEVLVQRAYASVYTMRTYSYIVHKECHLSIEHSNSKAGYLFNFGATIEELFTDGAKMKFEYANHIYYPIPNIGFLARPNSSNKVYELILFEFAEDKGSFKIEQFINPS